MMNGDNRWIYLILSLTLLLLVQTVAASASPAIDWQKVLGGSFGDEGNHIIQTADKGFMFIGSTASNRSGDVGDNHGTYDVWVVKLNATGGITWQKLLGGSDVEEGAWVEQTSDGGYILIGYTYSNASGDVGLTHGAPDIWVVKLNTTGEPQWQAVLGGSREDYGASIHQTTDGGYILTGRTMSNASGDVGDNHGIYDVWVVKLNATGTITWQQVLGGSGMEYGTAIHQTSDGGYILTGFTSSSDNGDVGPNHGLEDIWVLKLNATGNITWQKVLGGSGREYGADTQLTSGGGCIVTGYTTSSNSGDVGPNHGNLDVWVVNLDATGEIVWQSVLGGNSTDEASSISPTLGGEFVLTGRTASNSSGDVGPSHGSYDVWVVRLNATGGIRWQSVLGGQNTEVGKSIEWTSDGGYIFTGFTDSDRSGNVGPNHGPEDAWVVKLKFAVPLPGSSVPPTDPDLNGLYEDTNGNGRKDFQDVVLYFEQMDWIAANEPIAAFDFNNNDRIDFNDIVRLFGEI